MKLGKAQILALIETALFAIGAIFFLLMIISPASPIWMLIVGIMFGLAGAIMWLFPAIIRFLATFKNAKTRISDLSKSIQGADDPENSTYELRNPQSNEPNF
ncbi:MAG: hypothetical protein IKT33_03500 [Clostridia bacterium]|nr:hypothetical protein [Clostridia bacterium]